MKNSDKNQVEDTIQKQHLLSPDDRSVHVQLSARVSYLQQAGIQALPRSKRKKAVSQPEVKKAPENDPLLPLSQDPPSKPEHLTRPSRKSAGLHLAVYADLPDPFPIRGADGLAQIQDVLGHCKRCKLCQGRNKIVFGDGHPAPALVFVGEGPGAEEDRTGLPFVGAAGDLLTRMIVAMGLTRQDVYICNVVKCRPPGNRVPESDEMSQCGPFLRAQLQALAPKIIVALGRTPTQFLLETQAPMSKLRGQFADYQGIPVMPTYHPAYLLRSPSAKKDVWEDLQQVMKKLGLSGKQADPK